MATLNVALPEPLKAWVEVQAKNAGYAEARARIDTTRP